MGLAIRRALPVCVVATLLAVVPAAGGMPARARAAEAPPAGFFGMNAWGLPPASEFVQMAQGGVRTFRTEFNWGVIESQRGSFDWSYYDALVARAAAAKIAVSPFLFSSPAWAASQPSYPPTKQWQFSEWRRFCAGAVQRYGPHGTFWAANPTLPYLPIHAWQVWNEPTLRFYWPTHDATKYVQFASMTRSAIRAVDRKAEIVLGGLLEAGDKHSYVDLGQLYKVRGARRSFDAVGVHLYERGQKAMSHTLKLLRRVMKANGDGRKPLWVDEFGWATENKNGFLDRTTAGQAKDVGQSVQMMVKKRVAYRLERIMYFSWHDELPDPAWSVGAGLCTGTDATCVVDWWGIHTGLIGVNGTPKPSWYAYSRLARG